MCDKYRDHLQAVPRPPGIDYKQTSNHQANTKEYEQTKDDEIKTKSSSSSSSSSNNNNSEGSSSSGSSSSSNSSSSKDKIKNANDGGKAAFLGGGGYDEQCVGRSARPQLDVYKIPLAAAAAVATPETWGPDFFPASAVGAMFDGVS